MSTINETITISGMETIQKESYSGASIMLMSNSNNDVQTGQTGGTQTISWTLSWNNSGFIGQGWIVDGIDMQPYVINGSINQYGFSVAQDLKLQTNGCSSVVTIG